MMKKRSMAKIIVVCLALILGVAAAPDRAQAKSKGYKFTYKKVTVYMHGPAKKILKKAGTPIAKQVTKSCAYDGEDITYEFKDFILYTYTNEEGGKEYINGITFLTSKVKTKEKIKIGSSLKKVKKKYGKIKGKYGVYTYKKGKCKLQIEVKDKKVTNIRYLAS